MNNILVINEQNVKELMTITDAIQAVEEAYIEKDTKAGSVWPMVFHEFDPGHADLDIKSGDLGKSGVYGFKLVSWFGANESKGLPDLFGTSMLFDITTGAPIALINASALTGLRTGAAAAVGAKYLAKKDSKVLTMVGAGNLAAYAIAATLVTVPSIEQVIITNPSTPENATKKLKSIKSKVQALLSVDNLDKYAFMAVECTTCAVNAADIIITATPSHAPLFPFDSVKPGTHISSLGADMSGKCELDAELIKNAKFFVDDIDQSINVGEAELPIKNGIISSSHIIGEIGAVINGKKGRTTNEDITIFDSSGIALQDLASCKILYDKAKKANAGINVDL